MQEEVGNRAFNLVISTSKLIARTLTRAFQMYLGHRRKRKLRKGAKSNIEKESIANLLKDSKKLMNMEISEADIAGFEKYAKKYRVGYEIEMDDSVTPPRYLVFLRADDGKDMTKAFKTYLASIVQKKKKPSVLKQLPKLKEKVRAMPKKVHNRDKEHSP